MTSSSEARRNNDPLICSKTTNLSIFFVGILFHLAASDSFVFVLATNTVADDYYTGKGRIRGSGGVKGNRKLFADRLSASTGYGGSGAVVKDAEERIPRRTPAPGAPTPAPTASRNITYIPGQLTTMERDLILSQGLASKIIARTGRPVLYSDGNVSPEDFLVWPDGADTFEDPRPENPGGWIYVINSEDSRGGVGALTFDKEGEVVDYRRILDGTIWNCNGGRTPWGTWISAEEDMSRFRGLAWEVDPIGLVPAKAIQMGQTNDRGGGALEAFAYDTLDPSKPRFYLTEDDYYGALERWTPTVANWTEPAFNMLHGPGVSEYLLLEPNANNPSVGRFSWTTDLNAARDNAYEYYPTSEGIDVPPGSTLLYFVCKATKHLFRLDLINNSYLRQSTEEGLFEGEPDQLRKVLGDVGDGETMLYFTEDNGRRAGIHAKNERNELLTIVEGWYSPETTGLSFSPDKRFMYFCFQEDGFCFAIWRLDGLAFTAKTLKVKRNDNEANTAANDDRKRS